MAQIFVSTVYQINSESFNTPISMGFSPTNVKLRAIPSTTVFTAGPNNTRCYGIIETVPTGLRVDGVQHYVIETVAQLQALANA